MNKGKGKNSGITLVSLVVIIIVLLILAGVTIFLISGQNGIFKKAEGVEKNDKEAETVEKNDKEEEKELGALEEEITTNVDKMGEIDSSVLALKAGDYIKYDSGANGIITCRVLYPASSEYGLQIISDRNVKKVRLGSRNYSEAVTVYNKAIETLNNEAEAYVNTAYARDARCVGSMPTVNANGNFIQKDNGATEYVTLQFTNSSYINSLDGDENYTIDQAQMKTAGLWEKEVKFWLASRYVASRSSRCQFRVRIADESGHLGGYNLCTVYSSGSTDSYSGEYGLRPVISLRSDIIKITGGTGADADNAYIIGK